MREKSRWIEEELNRSMFNAQPVIGEREFVATNKEISRLWSEIRGPSLDMTINHYNKGGEYNSSP